VILTDLGLPDSTGADTVDAILAAWPDTPVVVLTGLADRQIGLDVNPAVDVRRIAFPSGHARLFHEHLDRLADAALADPEHRRLGGQPGRRLRDVHIGHDVLGGLERGDGPAELLTQGGVGHGAVQYGLPVKVVILNNRFLGMVRQWQELFHAEKYSFTNTIFKVSMMEINNNQFSPF